jgi:hypothetical protein
MEAAHKGPELRTASEQRFSYSPHLAFNFKDGPVAQNIPEQLGD